MSNTTQKVMASVLVIYTMRTLFGATAFKVYALLLSVWGIGRLVWVSKVFENFAVVEKSGVQAVGNFVLTALTHAHVEVQLVLFVALLAGVSLVFDFARAAPRSARFAA
jgi:hypothetical protein